MNRCNERVLFNPYFAFKISKLLTKYFRLIYRA